MQSTPDPLNILVVDDEKGIRDGSKRIISRMGCNALTAENGEKGLDAIKQTDVDIVLLDLKMPGMDGITLLSTLIGLYPDMPFVMMTGHGTMGTAIAALRLGENFTVVGRLRNAG